MPKQYVRLTDDEREEIMLGAAAGSSAAEIARGLKRATSTVTREMNMYPQGPRAYRAQKAGKLAGARLGSRRRGKSKLSVPGPLQDYVHAMVAERWSPEQVARRIAEEYPHDMTMRISDESIYRYIYVLPRGELKRALIRGLRQERKSRRTGRAKGGDAGETRGKIADMLSIEERPQEVADRIVPGHWEGDLIVGKLNASAVGTLVERTTRYTIIVPLGAKDAASVRKAFARAIRTLPAELRKSVTYDNGKEMSQHKDFTLATGMRVYFAHPHSPWERGTNENTNMLIRQYFPKGTDFRKVSSGEIKAVQRSLNGRPRQSLNYKTPREAFQSLLR